MEVFFVCSPGPDQYFAIPLLCLKLSGVFIHIFLYFTIFAFLNNALIMNYNRINNITGWLIFLIAFLVYYLTAERTASYWDCGEFISCSYHLMSPHPPGAPFFLLIGRMFSLFADPLHVAFMINLVSGLCSAFTSLFLFWSITTFAKRILQSEGNTTLSQTILIMGAGIVGSLAYTFTDSAWFNAVEAEVYAMSSFFTAFVFWAILKWEARSEEINSDRWLILIAYMMGLSIGVHLLNLLTIFALAFVVYFKKFPVTLKGVVATTAIAGAVTLTILIGIIPGLPSIAGSFEITFVNDFSLPFGSGIIFFSLLVIGAIIYGIYYSIKHQKRILNTGLICLTFILIGYASYGIIVIRSTYDPPIDMNDPDDIIHLVDYLKRKQYGDRPLFVGPTFATAGYYTTKRTSPVYRKGKDKYIAYDYDYELVYADKYKMLFPRIYSGQPNHIRAYRRWCNLPSGKPTMGDNLEFLFKYQIGHMYLRYFGWNFIGRESDVQDAGTLAFESDKDLPHTIKTNKARNRFFMLPFILGLAGLFFHFNRHKMDAWIVMLLFFFTGVAIVLYLNQPPVEPRERDYTFAGSFWAFSIWIGLGVLFLADLLKSVIRNDMVRNVLASIVCLVVPGILAAEGWDDHDRSNRFHSVDSARNMLSSCAPNAILFTGGDNDTYPLWYVQEVEGFRTDVRVCNLSLLNTYWYIEQMKKKAHKSEPLPIRLPLDRFIDGTNDGIGFRNEVPQPLDVQTVMDYILTDNPTFQEDRGGGKKVFIFPSNTLKLKVNKQALQNDPNVVAPEYKPYIVDEMVWSIRDGAIEKKEMIMMDIILNNQWKRPIYFASSVHPSDYMYLREYTQLEGLAYRLLPVKIGRAPNGWVNTDTMYNNMMNKFQWRELDNPKAYYNEWYYIFTTQERSMFQELADQLLQEGKKDKAKAALLYSLNVMPDKSLPYDEPIVGYVPLLIKVGEEKKAMEIINTMGPRLDDNIRYAIRHGVYQDIYTNVVIALQFENILRDEGKKEEAQKYHGLLEKYADEFEKAREVLGLNY